MSYNDEKNLSELKKVYLFKYFIQFLEIYGQETFGENYPVNWAAVHCEIVGNSIWDNNEELDNILYNKNESLDSIEFRDKVFTYIENQILKGYPVFRLFNLSPWLKKCYDDEIDRKIYNDDLKEFKSKKCYKCKHFYDNLQVYMGDPSKNLRGSPYYPLEDFKQYYPDADIKNQILVHNRICDLHQEYLNEFEKFIESRPSIRHLSFDEYRMEFNKYIDKNNLASGTKYSKIEDNCWGGRYESNYTLHPLSNRQKCTRFEPIEDYNFDKFLEKFIELR